VDEPRFLEACARNDLVEARRLLTELAPGEGGAAIVQGLAAASVSGATEVADFLRPIAVAASAALAIGESAGPGSPLVLSAPTENLDAVAGSLAKFLQPLVWPTGVAVACASGAYDDGLLPTESPFLAVVTEAEGSGRVVVARFSGTEEAFEEYVDKSFQRWIDAEGRQKFGLDENSDTYDDDREAAWEYWDDNFVWEDDPVVVAEFLEYAAGQWTQIRGVLDAVAGLKYEMRREPTGRDTMVFRSWPESVKRGAQALEAGSSVAAAPLAPSLDTDEVERLVAEVLDVDADDAEPEQLDALADYPAEAVASGLAALALDSGRWGDHYTGCYGLDAVIAAMIRDNVLSESQVAYLVDLALSHDLRQVDREQAQVCAGLVRAVSSRDRIRALLDIFSGMRPYRVVESFRIIARDKRARWGRPLRDFRDMEWLRVLRLTGQQKEQLQSNIEHTYLNSLSDRARTVLLAIMDDGEDAVAHVSELLEGHTVIFDSPAVAWAVMRAARSSNDLVIWRSVRLLYAFADIDRDGAGCLLTPGAYLRKLDCCRCSGSASSSRPAKHSCRLAAVTYRALLWPDEIDNEMRNVLASSDVRPPEPQFEGDLKAAREVAGVAAESSAKPTEAPLADTVAHPSPAHAEGTPELSPVLAEALRALASRDADAQGRAAEQLADAGASAIPALLTGLSNRSRGCRAWCSAVLFKHAAERLPAVRTDGVVQALVGHIADPDFETRRTCAVVLGLVGSPEALVALRGAAESGDEITQAGALAGLYAAGNEQAHEWLFRILGTGSADGRWAAARSLGLAGRPGRDVEALRAALSDRSKYTREGAQLAIEDIERRTAAWTHVAAVSPESKSGPVPADPPPEARQASATCPKCGATLRNRSFKLRVRRTCEASVISPLGHVVTPVMVSYHYEPIGDVKCEKCGFAIDVSFKGDGLL